MLAIGSRIKNLRKQHRLTQQELARYTGIARGNISNYEAGRFLPSAEAIVALARFFGITTDELLLGTTSPPRPAEEEELLALYHRLPAAKRQELLDFARFLLLQTENQPTLSSPHPDTQKSPPHL